MRKFIYISIMPAIIFLFMGCAQRYFTVNPTKVDYTVANNHNNIILNYRYDILSEKGNTKISKKERKSNVKLVAVKITNNTDTIINIGKNVAFFNGNYMIYPMDAISTMISIKQSVPSHLWYLLLSPLTLSVNGSSPLPIGLILGPVISGSNMLISGSANNNLKKELIQYEILFRDIKPGETVFGLVGFRNLDYVPLIIKHI